MTSYSETVTFHGHSCPGLAIGYRMTRSALDALNRYRAEDEELVAVVENDACGVDALQYLSGCTFGKGNLIFKDHGKHAYTLFCRHSKKAVRVVFNRSNFPKEIDTDREALTRWILDAGENEIVSLSFVEMEEPSHARIRDSATCQCCRESVMASRTRQINGRPTCIDCARAMLAAGGKNCGAKPL